MSTNLTSEIREYIKNIIKEEIDKYMLTEMALSLSDYKFRVESIMQQILENWCLIRYCTLTGDKIENKNHWKTELIAHINNIAGLKIKNGNSIVTKTNAIFKLWNMYDWDTDESCIAQRLFSKFYKENISTKSEVYSQIVSDFKNETKKLAYALTDTSPDSIVEYVNNI